MRHWRFAILWYFICALWASTSAAGENVRVDAPVGTVLGSSRDGYERFGYVPYAQPPTKERRWRPPVPMLRFPGADATHDGSDHDWRPVCPQPRDLLADLGTSTDQDEDCLFLFVWRPAGTRPDAQLPVAFFIHGGAHGQGSGTDGMVKPDQIVDGTILVTINYRLSYFGFMNDLTSRGDENVEHYAGLLDNLEALRFVRRNIAAFGGDSERVTVFGESAGATNCMFLLTSRAMVEDDEQLFSRMFVMSPAFLHQSRWYTDDMKPRLLAEAAGCLDMSRTDDYDEAWACLRNKSWEEIWGAMPGQGAQRIRYLLTLSEPYDPTSLASLLFLQPRLHRRKGGSDSGHSQWPTSVLERLEDGKIAAVDVVVGQTRDEGTLFNKLAFLVKNVESEEFFRSMMQKALSDGNDATSLNLQSHYLQKISTATSTANGNRSYSVWEAQAEFSGDLIFSVNVHLALTTLAKHQKPGNKLFHYVFSYEPEGGARFMGVDMKAAHTLELNYLFGNTGRPMPYDAVASESAREKNREVSERFSRLFVDFARRGKAECLEQYDSSRQAYCEISAVSGELRTRYGYKKEVMRLWERWMATVPGRWPVVGGERDEFEGEPIVSYLLNGLLIDEAGKTMQDWRRMMGYGLLIAYLIGKLLQVLYLVLFGCCRWKQESVSKNGPKPYFGGGSEKNVKKQQ